MWNGKKSERLLLRMSEEMASTVRALAELHHRRIQDEIRFLIARGLEHSMPEMLKEKPGPQRQLPSTGVNSRQPKSEDAA
jgi:hypothetical protein